MAAPFEPVNRPTGLITNEYAGWHEWDATAVRSAVWRSDGGSLFGVHGTGPSGHAGQLAYTGALDSDFADKYSQTHTHSNKMRFWTRQGGFGDVKVETDIKPVGFSAGAPSSWAGFKFYLRRQLDATESSFYTAEPYIEDGHAFIQKKCYGVNDPSGNNTAGGTYYLLASKSGTEVPVGSWHTVAASSKTNADGSVTIRLYRDGALTLEATDRGIGCPVLGPGRVGFRSDFFGYYLDNWTVTAIP